MAIRIGVLLAVGVPLVFLLLKFGESTTIPEFAGTAEELEAYESLEPAPAEPTPAPNVPVAEPAAEPGALLDLEVSLEPDATLVVRHDGAAILTARHMFWAKDFEWAHNETHVAYGQSDRLAISGRIDSLGIEIAGDVVVEAPNVYRFDYLLEAERDLADIKGGGLEWRPVLAPPSFDDSPDPPELLPDNRGWRWTLAPEKTVEVVFGTRGALVYFERGNKDQIRTRFVGERLDAGLHVVSMTVRLPSGTRRTPAAAERYGPVQLDEWHPNLLRWDSAPVDLSFLNDPPAGKHGLIRAEGEGLVFEDGTPARFWGANVAAYALFRPNEEIELQAKRIAQFGFNLIRIHHHDSMGWVNPTVIDLGQDDSRHLDPDAMDRVDYWIKCLRDEGVYVWLDLHVGRVFKEGDVNTPWGRMAGFDEIARHDGMITGFSYYNDIVQRLMIEFQENYLTHVNPYVGLAYKDDPAVVGILITNENDLTTHFGNLMLPDHNNPVHNAMFEQSVTEFANRAGLPRKQTWETWKPGPSKIYLTQQEHVFNTTMLKHLRGLGVKAPVATTNYWSGLSAFSLRSLTDGDLIDVHSYGESEALDINPHYESNYVTRIAGAQVYGKPLTVTEWKVPYPETDRFTAPLYVAGVACLQGWDAPMMYNYSQGSLTYPHSISLWSSYMDPAVMGIMPAAALAYRQQHVRSGDRTYYVNLNRAQTYFRRTDAESSATIRTLAETSKVTIGLPDVPELDWDVASRPGPGVEVITDVDRDFIPSGQTYVESDTGELRRDWHKGIHTINTAKTQAASGWLGGETVALDHVRIELSTPKAVVAVTSLDDTPIADSAKILVTVVGRATTRERRPPFLSEPVIGTVQITAPPGLDVFPLESDGQRRAPLTDAHASGVYTIELDQTTATHWFILE